MIGFMINNKHSYRDYGLVLQNPYQLTPPMPRTHYVSVPGRSGQLDLTESLTGRVEYENRILTLELGGIKTDWPSFFTLFLREVHGKVVKIIFDNDKSQYFLGRAKVVEGFEKVGRLGTFLVEVECEPYRYNTAVYSYTGTVTSKATVTAPSSVMPIIPEITCTIATGDTLKVTNNNQSFSLKNGYQKMRAMELCEDFKMVFEGKGTISVVAQGGCL